MFQKFVVLLCLLSFFPAAVSAQELAQLNTAQPALELKAEQTAPASINLSAPMPKDEVLVLAANHVQSDQQSAKMTEERPRKTHTGLTFGEFVDVHFGDYRWIWWAAAVGGIVAIHAF